jgi:hypothetical protein
VALLGMSSGLEHSGRQMLGPNSQWLLSPKHKGVRRGSKGVESK